MKTTSVAAIYIVTTAFIIGIINKKYLVEHNSITKKIEHVSQIEKLFNYRSLPIEKFNKLDFLDKTMLSAGKEEMSKHKAVFSGITRDNAKHLPEIMNHIEYIGESFKDYRVIIFENDSHDETKMMLNLWKSVNPKVLILSEDLYNKKRPSIKFLADIRNKYLEALQRDEYQDFDIVITMDMDMKYGIDIRAIQDSFSKIDRWDMVCSNGIFDSHGHMYDTFAFRSKELPEHPKAYYTEDKVELDKEYHKKRRKIYLPTTDLLPVYSCFNGFAIYQRKILENCFYDSPEGDCEHIALHECMRSKHNARIFMNPAQLIRHEDYR